MDTERNASPTLPDGAILVLVTDTSAATRARERFARTGETTSPWRALPERESYELVEHWLVEGTVMERRRSSGRWGGVYATPGAWSALRPLAGG